MKQVIPFISQLADQEQQIWLTALNQAIPNAEIVSAKQLKQRQQANCRVAIVANPNPQALAEFTNLEWIQSLWAGVERLVAEINRPELKIVRLVDPQLANTMAEAVLTWCLYLHRQVPLYQTQQVNKQWLQHAVGLTKDKTVGVLGLGKLGQHCAERLALNGFKVNGWSQSPKIIADVDCYHGEDGLYDVAQQADILVVLLPLTSKTENLINKHLIEQMPQGSQLINFARGKIINTEHLLTALASGQLSHAVLDVFEQEPLPTESPLWHHPQLTILPHISAPTNVESASKIVADNINSYLINGTIPDYVDIAQGY